MAQPDRLNAAGLRVVLITRAGAAQLPTASTLLQQDDVVHVAASAADVDGPGRVEHVLEHLGDHR